MHTPSASNANPQKFQYSCERKSLQQPESNGSSSISGYAARVGNKNVRGVVGATLNVFGRARQPAPRSALELRRASIIAFRLAPHANFVGIETALTTMLAPVDLVSGAGTKEDLPMLRPLIAAVLVSAALASSTTAQNVDAATAHGPTDMYWTGLAFSKDGRILRETGSLNERTAAQGWRVRISAYDAVTGALISRRDLPPYTSLYSQTSDGRIMLIAADVDKPDAQAHLFLLHTESGETQDIPREWFDADETRPYAAISGDGRLVSTFSEWSPEYPCMLVKIYDWGTKTLVAKQTRGEFAGGFSSGAVTEDGKIAFSNNRSGTYIVDPGTGQTLLHLGNDAFRSPNGQWVVEFPDRFYGDSGTNVTIRDGENGRVLGNLDLPMSEDEAKKPWQGVFCGASGKFIAATDGIAAVFAIPSGKKIASFSVATWLDASPTGYSSLSVACTSNGKRVAIRSGSRLTFHSMK
jgi:hypothetical protein